MKNKIVLKKRNVKKKIVKRRKFRPTSNLQVEQWGRKLESLARKPHAFNKLKGFYSELKPSVGISGDPFYGQGNEETVIMKPIPFEKSYLGTQMGYKEPATRGELGAAPAHYSKGKFTPWEVIDDWKLDYYCGNAVKYVCRHKHKGKPVEDIQKAIDCLIKYKQDLMEFYATQEKINTISNFMDMDKETK